MRVAMRIACAIAMVWTMLVLAACGQDPRKQDAPAWDPALADRVAKVDWAAKDDASFRALDDALAALRKRETPRERALFLEKVAAGFVKDEIARLESELRKIDDDPNRYGANRELLKAYLTITDATGEHVEVAWATTTFATSWCSRLGADGRGALCATTAAHPEGYVRPILDAFFGHRSTTGEAAPPAPDAKLVEQARSALARVPIRARYKALFVDALDDEKYDPRGPLVPENQVFPSVTLGTLFRSRPIVAPSKDWVLDSRKRLNEQKPFEVRGAYTTKAHAIVFAQLESAEDILRSEAWIVPLDADEQMPGTISSTAKAVRDDYQERYIDAWASFLDDIVVRRPSTVDECLHVLEELTKSDYPIVVILDEIAEQTQWPDKDPPPDPLGSNATMGRPVPGGPLSQRLGARLHPSGGLRFGPLPSTLAQAFSRVGDRFTSLASFVTRQPPDHLRYLAVLKHLQKVVARRRREVSDLELRGLDAELRAARGKVEALLNASYDVFAVGVLRSLLLPPLTSEPSKVPRPPTK